jgi:NADH-quinone oxidoreductase subunit M
MKTFPLLTYLTLIPLMGGLITLFGSGRKAAARNVALVWSLLALIVSALLWFEFDPRQSGFQFVERANWAPALGIYYYLGVDGLGLVMVILSALITPFAIMASWKAIDNPKLFFALILFLEAGLFGTFTALNFFHWFIFWEASLIPAFFLIKMWGGSGRSRAANQFFIYTLAGSVTLLLGFLALYSATGIFDFTGLAEAARNGGLENALFAKLGGTLFHTKAALSTAVFLGILFGFAVKAPLMPFHTWLPGAYAEAPTGASMLLTGAMSKMGVYGFLRVLLPLFPEQMRAMQTPLLALAVVTIIFPAAAALAQTDLKRMLAYSSINHVGYCLLGIFAAVKITGDNPALAGEKAAALNGVILQMFNHGLTAASLFYFVGLIEERSGGLRGVGDFGGLRKVAPVFCGLMGIALFASLGLPGLNGFAGEFLILKGALPLAGWAAALSTLGLLLTAVFLLAILQRVFSGPLQHRWTGWADLTLSERFTVAPVIGLIFLLGVCPQILISLANPVALAVIERF